MQRKLQLDGVRGIAVLLIFFYHALHVPVWWCGVDLFFVLSGYLITGILLRMKEQQRTTGAVLKDFYTRRACRILPAFLLFLLLGTVVFNVHWRQMWYWYAFFDANFANAFDKVANSAFVPLWSLAVEEQFYFVWPLLVLLSSVRTLKRLSLGVIVLAPILRAVCTPFVPQACIYCLTPFRMDTLAWGAAIAIFEREDPSFVRSHHRLAAICSIAAGTVFCLLSPLQMFRLNVNSLLFNTFGYSLVGGMFGGMILHVLGSHRGFVYSLFTLKPLRYMGQISYTFYLYHLGVLILLRQHFHSAMFNCALAFGITGTIAASSWRFWESPILRLQRSVAGGRAEARVTEMVQAK